jgi:hypothetical protein
VWACFLLLAFVVVACTGRDDTSASGASTSADVPPAGGILTLGELTLEVPAGALDETTRITIRRSKEAVPAGYDAYGSIFRFEPEGLAFNVPARVTIGHRGGDAPALLWTARLDPTFFQRIEGRVDGDRLEARIDHFSGGFVGAEKCRPNAACVEGCQHAMATCAMTQGATQVVRACACSEGRLACSPPETIPCTGGAPFDAGTSDAGSTIDAAITDAAITDAGAADTGALDAGAGADAAVGVTCQVWRSSYDPEPDPVTGNVTCSQKLTVESNVHFWTRSNTKLLDGPEDWIATDSQGVNEYYTVPSGSPIYHVTDATYTRYEVDSVGTKYILRSGNVVDVYESSARGQLPGCQFFKISVHCRGTTTLGQ